MNLQDTLDQIQNIDFSDTDKIGVWPMPVRAAIWVLVFALLIGLTYWFFIKDLQLSLDSLKNIEVSKRAEFEQKAKEAANLEQYRAHMNKMRIAFDGLLNQLPKDIEIPNLIDDITEKAESSGLNLVSNDFLNEVVQEYIVEKPIKIVVAGNTYHDLGGFISGIAGMPRIVTLHQYSIKKRSQDKNNPQANGLEMVLTAKTYKYKNDGEKL